MRNPVSYKFNPQADNALQTIGDIVSDYRANLSQEWASTIKTVTRAPEELLETTRSFENAPSIDGENIRYNFLNVSHFDGKVFFSHTSSSVHEDVREVPSFQKRQPEEKDSNVIPLHRVAALG